MTLAPSFDGITVDCGDLSVRAINQAIRAAQAAGATQIRLLRPRLRHNLGVALPAGISVTIEGSVGYYVAGLNNGAPSDCARQRRLGSGREHAGRLGRD